jgi:outer membrane murein-binding lipoprotein Lpp
MSMSDYMTPGAGGCPSLGGSMGGGIGALASDVRYLSLRLDRVEADVDALAELNGLALALGQARTAVERLLRKFR